MSTPGLDLPLSPPRMIYLVHGPEITLRRDALSAIRAAVVDPATEDFNCDEFVGGECSGGDILTAAQTLPMMSERRLVVVRQVHKLKAADLSLLGDYVASPAAETTLVLEAEKVDLRKSPFPAIKKVGAVVACKALYENQAASWLTQRARGMGIRLQPDAAQFLISYVGSSTGALEAELTKAIDYVGKAGAPIDLDAVSATAGQGRVHSIFELVDAVSARQAGAALAALVTLLESGEAPIKVQAMIVRQFRMIWRAREAMDKGERNLAQALGIAPFVAKKLAAPARRFNEADLVRIFQGFATVDLDLKGGATSPRQVLESEVLALCA